MIKVYNSLSQRKEEFLLRPGDTIKMYTCGVTVYDVCHIGHARSLYIFDLIRRYLLYRGFKVEFVRNITDIDDKIIRRAEERDIDWRVLTEEYIGKYYADLASLGIAKADQEPRATEAVPDIIRFIEALIQKGYAYATQSGVYFSVRKFPGYGKLSGQSIDEMKAGVRKEPDETKDDPLDFALWKISKPSEPFWESPWGRGRPGWHIECSVMSQKFLNTDTLTIHAGGRDLLFPHHENEIAQSEAKSGKQFSRYWIHHGLLTIQGQKMAKSLGNFITIQDVLTRFPAAALKLFYLNAHYSQPVDFSWQKLDEAKKAYERICSLKDRLEMHTRLRAESSSDSTLQSDEFLSYKERFLKYLDDDFNTPRALSAFFEFIGFCNKMFDGGQSFFSSEDFVSARILLNELMEILGIFSSQKSERTVDESMIEELIQRRIVCKQNKDFVQADKIRSELLAQGIIVEDTKEGSRWRRKA